MCISVNSQNHHKKITFQKRPLKNAINIFFHNATHVWVRIFVFKLIHSFSWLEQKAKTSNALPKWAFQNGCITLFSLSAQFSVKLWENIELIANYLSNVLKVVLLSFVVSFVITLDQWLQSFIRFAKWLCQQILIKSHDQFFPMF